MMNQQELNQLVDKTKDFNPQQIIKLAFDLYGEKLTFATSMGAEDQVITDMIQKLKLPISIFTLDTGRLFPETYSLIDKTNMHYGIKIKVFFPQSDAVQSMVNAKGINLFYESIENRKECCNVRKIEPLKRAFKGSEAWICGLRREQSVTRTQVEAFEWDAFNSLVKINPLFKWSEAMVWEYLKTNSVPYNKLQDQGFLSIGCQPCTRAVAKGEDVRAGRWWWESPEHKECGLHAKPKH